jgi:hypothetical protein
MGKSNIRALSSYESIIASSLVTAQVADTGICRYRPRQGALFLDCGYSATGESRIVDWSIERRASFLLHGVAHHPELKGTLTKLARRENNQLG